MPRVYERKFDWDEAARLYRDGWSGIRLAEHFGVTVAAIYAALGKLGVNRRPASTLKVRDGLAYCPNCDEWKPLSEFSERRLRPRAARYCRRCDTERKRAWRAKNPTYERDYQRARRQTAA